MKTEKQKKQEAREYRKKNLVHLRELKRKRRQEDLDEIFNLLQLALFICLVMALTCFSLASAIHAGETLTQTLDMENITSYNITGNSSEVNLTTNLNKFTLQIPTGYPVEEFNISFYGYKADAPVEILYSSGGNSYAPKKAIVIYPNSTNNSQSAIHSAIDNETNPESAENVLNNITQDSQSLFGRFWDWLVNLWNEINPQLKIMILGIIAITGVVIFIAFIPNLFRRLFG